jgi:hypothetical protein
MALERDLEEGVSVQPIMKRNLRVVLAALVSALACGATFLFALFRQFALVEVAASIATGLEVYFLSSSIGDLLEDRPEPNHLKMVAAIALAIAIITYFWISKYFHP